MAGRQLEREVLLEEFTPSDYNALDQEANHLASFENSYAILGGEEGDEIMLSHQGIFASTSPKDNFGRVDDFGSTLCAYGERRLRRQNGGSYSGASIEDRWNAGLKEFAAVHNKRSRTTKVVFLKYQAKTPNMGSYGFNGVVAVRQSWSTT